MRHDQSLIYQFLTELSLLQYAACCYETLVEHPDYSLPLPPPAIDLCETTDSILDQRISDFRSYPEANKCEHVEVALGHLLQRIENTSK